MSSAFQLSGLASGFDWKSFVDQLMIVSHAPADRLATEKARNNQKVSVLDGLATKLAELQTSASSLATVGAFGARSVGSGTVGSTWSNSAAAGTAIGGYKIAVSQLATAAHRDGATNLGTRLSATSDSGAMSALTLANLPIGSAITAGTFTVNGAKVTVALTDSLQSVFTAIATATGGAVTAGYNPGTDKIELTGYVAPDPVEVVLGAANDTSNLLSALKLANNGGSSVASTGALGTVKTNAALSGANLTTAITAVDGAGDGTFSINGVSIAYNVNTDTLSSVLTKINQAGAGVTATYDAANDRVSLRNNTTGDIGIGLSESAGGLLGALGLTTGATLVHGENAEFTLNDGATLSSLSNTLDATSHGVTGLAVTVNSVSTETIQVTSDGAGMRGRIEDFVAKFNAVQAYIDSATKVTTDSKGKVSAAVLADNRDIQAWGSSLRSTAFAEIPGLTGSIGRLEALGIDYKTGTSELEIKDGAKLDAALRDKSDDVEDFFQTATTGFSAKIASLVTNGTDQGETLQDNLNKANTSLDAQIADIERRLEQQRAIMESAFINMELAQSNLKSQQAALTNAFPTATK